MSPDMIEAASAVVTLLVGLTAWLWKTHERAGAAHLKFDIFKESTDRELSSLKNEQRELRDGHVRMDTTLQQVTVTLASLTRQLQPLPAMAESIRNIESDVSELKSQLVPRAETEARFRAIEDRLS